MRIARYLKSESAPRLGMVEGERLYDLSAFGEDDPLAVLTLGPADRTALAEKARRTEPLALAEVVLTSPIAPPEFLAVGFNYPAHIEELRVDSPRSDIRLLAQVGEGTQVGFPDQEFLTVFNKQTTCVTGPKDPIWKPDDVEWVDYEGEIAVVVGRSCRRADENEAAEAIAGYLLCNDVSVREWQFSSPTVWMGKSFETHGPLGPWITSADSIDDPDAMEIRTLVNGELRQRDRLGSLITSIPAIIAQISQVSTIEPGTVITTGSPAGIGLADGRYLTVGDRVRIEVDELGSLDNDVIKEPAESASAVREHEHV